jgi:hypothetical protein
MATTKTYGPLIQHVFAKRIDFTNDTIKVALVAGTYTPNQDAHSFWSEVSANEVTGTGYTAGGATLGTKSVAYDNATNRTTFTGANVSWPNSTITARYAVIYDDSPATAATKPIIAYVDFGSNQASSSGTFTVAWSGSGIFTTTAD